MKQEINGLWGGRVWRFDELPSTNTWAMEHVSALGHGDVVWAVSQTDGRGRMGRNWISSPGRCLTVSLVIDDPALARLGVNLGQIAACAVVDLLGLCGIKGSLKWPNDVLVDGGKIAGLLVERDAVSGFFVLGVGLNINLTSGELSAARLHRPATSMQVIAGREFDGEALLTPLLQCLERRLDGVTAEEIALAWMGRTEHRAVTSPLITPATWGRVMIGDVTLLHDGSAAFEVSADNGATWQPATPWAWTTVPTPGDHWRIRVTLTGKAEVTRLGMVGMG